MAERQFREQEKTSEKRENWQSVYMTLATVAVSDGERRSIEGRRQSRRRQSGLYRPVRPYRIVTTGHVIDTAAAVPTRLLLASPRDIVLRCFLRAHQGLCGGPHGCALGVCCALAEPL